MSTEEQHFAAEAQALPAEVNIDAAFWQARREAAVVLILFFISLAWTLIVCHRAGYLAVDDSSAAELTLVWGMPAWVFWGIVFPWLVIDVVAIWFCFGYMQDDDSVADGEAGLPTEWHDVPDSADFRERATQ